MKLHYPLELLTCVIYLSGAAEEGFFAEQKNAYTELIDQHLGAYRNHPAVTEFPALWEKGLFWEDIPCYAINLSQDISLAADADITSGFRESMIASEIPLRQYTAILQDFALQSGFPAFFQKVKQDNADFLARLDEILIRHPARQILEKYLGTEIGKSHIFVSNLHRTSYCIPHQTAAGTEVYSFCSSYFLRKAQANNDVERLLFSMVWHETMHSVINPLTYEQLGNPEDKTDAQQEWLCELNESIIWAITLRLLLRENIINDQAIEPYCANARRCRAPHTRILHDLLLDYEQNRATHPGIASFHPILLKAVGSLHISA